ncbi:FAD-dependent monooxygenase [Pseudactinotalea terrae]|uniref:FAD-dependent monooxygenase n=1 Tax=Pseudactinotalea terrae TaxID=1743262 RepID=UPI0012E31310|nr:FAD-dependent monooxygenase [Pseudactinotalea terrae]
MNDTITVVGAGPTGLTAALVLAHHGIQARVLDRRDAASTASRALGLQARSMELLAMLGVADRVEQTAYRLAGSSIMRGERVVARQRWFPPDSPYPYTYVVPQQGLETMLRDRLAELGGAVEWGRAVTGVAADPSGVTLRTAGDGDLRADWVVGADGAGSTIRQAAGIAFPGERTGEVYHLADVRFRSDPDLGDGAMWLGASGPLMLMRLPDDGLWRVFIDVTDEGSAQAVRPDRASLQALLDRRGPGTLEVREVGWTSVFRSRLCLAEAYRSGRLLLAGDAAHVFPPFGGQGMNLGIQDAVGLAWRLARVADGAPPEMLDDYARERRAVAATVIRDVGARRRIFALRHPLARAWRDVMLRVVSASSLAARAASRSTSQIDLSYRTGRRTAAPAPGDRAPDAPLPTGSLHEAFRVDHFALLRIGASPALPPLPEPVTVIDIDDDSDPDGDVRRRYRMDAGLVLVRPDGHIGYRGTDVDSVVAAITASSPTYDRQS